jgi:hypothetical protein
LFAARVPGGAEVLSQLLPVGQVDAGSVDRQQTKLAELQLLRVFLLKRFSQEDDQVDPKRKRHSTTSLHKGFFGHLGGVVAMRMVLAALLRLAPLAIFLCLADGGRAKRLLVLQDLQRAGQHGGKIARCVNGGCDPQPSQIHQPQRTLDQVDTGSFGGLRQQCRRHLVGKRSNSSLTNIVPYITPTFILEHGRVLLTINMLSPNTLSLRGLAFCQSKLSAIGLGPEICN